MTENQVNLQAQYCSWVSRAMHATKLDPVAKNRSSSTDISSRAWLTLTGCWNDAVNNWQPLKQRNNWSNAAFFDWLKFSSTGCKTAGRASESRVSSKTNSIQNGADEIVCGDKACNSAMQKELQKELIAYLSVSASAVPMRAAFMPPTSVSKIESNGLSFGISMPCISMHLFPISWHFLIPPVLVWNLKADPRYSKMNLWNWAMRGAFQLPTLFNQAVRYSIVETPVLRCGGGKNAEVKQKWKIPYISHDKAHTKCEWRIWFTRRHAFSEISVSFSRSDGLCALLGWWSNETEQRNKHKQHRLKIWQHDPFRSSGICGESLENA